MENKILNIKIKNCNNIDDLEITIEKEKLNIKYGINGTGKSTISDVIRLYFLDKEQNTTNNIKKLTPYKYRSTNLSEKPEISGLEHFTNVNIFNENYIKNTVFKEKEIVKGSFKIFVKDKEYDKRMFEIEQLIKELKNFFEQNETINNLISTLEDLSKQTKTTNSGDMHSGNDFVKAFENGNLIENIPENFQEYSNFIKNKERVSWINRQTQGQSFIDIDEKCPCCANGIDDNKKSNIKSISNHYKKTNITHLDKIIQNFEKIKNYFNPKTWNIIEGILKKGKSPEQQEKEYILSIKLESEKIINYLKNIKGISFFSLKDENNIKEKIESFKIQKELLNYFKGEEFENYINEINGYVDKLVQDIGNLQGKIKNHKICIKGQIEKSKEAINEFLDKGGYKYIIDSIETGEEIQLIIKPKGGDIGIDEDSNGFSFGERNAFSIIMFMFESINNGSDLIILDDPISSFDNNKKFAILDMLFSNQIGKNNFFKKTVLMLTHDFEPVIDIIYNNLPKCMKDYSYAHFISNQNGKLIEKEIKKKDIKLFTNILKSKLESDKIYNINKLVYLRRLFELNDNKSLEYNLLSSLIHKREHPYKKNEGECIFLDESEINESTNQVKSYGISDFDYELYLKKLQNNDELIELYKNTPSNYEKLQLFRIITGENENINSVITKFINETFHIENDYLFQLDSFDYEIVPEYIIAECNNEILKYKTK